MPLVFLPNTQQQVVARGERLGWCKKFLMWVGWPVDVQSQFSDDVYTITKHHPPILQIKDEDAMRRRAAARAQSEAEAKKSPNPGREPRIVIPKMR